MEIKRINIKEFRNLRDIKIDVPFLKKEGKKNLAVIGKNNSGKTNLLLALEWASSIFDRSWKDGNIMNFENPTNANTEIVYSNFEKHELDDLIFILNSLLIRRKKRDDIIGENRELLFELKKLIEGINTTKKRQNLEIQISMYANLSQTKRFKKSIKFEFKNTLISFEDYSVVNKLLTVLKRNKGAHKMTFPKCIFIKSKGKELNNYLINQFIMWAYYEQKYYGSINIKMDSIMKLWEEKPFFQFEKHLASSKNLPEEKHFNDRLFNEIQLVLDALSRRIFTGKYKNYKMYLSLRSWDRDEEFKIHLWEKANSPSHLMFSENPYHSLDYASVGIKHYLQLRTFIMNNESANITLIDEPEIFLENQFQKEIISDLERVINDYSNFFVFTSNSPNILYGPKNAFIEIKDEDNHETIKPILSLKDVALLKDNSLSVDEKYFKKIIADELTSISNARKKRLLNFVEEGEEDDDLLFSHQAREFLQMTLILEMLMRKKMSRISGINKVNSLGALILKLDKHSTTILDPKLKKTLAKIKRARNEAVHKTVARKIIWPTNKEIVDAYLMIAALKVKA